VEQSTTTVPGRAPSIVPSFPRWTSSTSGPSETAGDEDVGLCGSLSRAREREDRRGAPERSLARRTAFSSVRFVRARGKPFAARLRAMPRPIVAETGEADAEGGVRAHRASLDALS